MHDRTTIIITHKMFMVQEMDNIVVLDGNRVVQEGRHEELMGEDGLYRELYRQVQGEVDRTVALPPNSPLTGVER
jgi:ATP-binding cassette subfamily C protein CydC